MPDLKNSTSNNFGLSEETSALIQSVFSRFPGIREVRMFGSRAMGNYRSGSDIDLAVFGDSLTHDDLMDVLGELEDLELLYEIDCIDYHKITEPALQEHIRREGKTFYSAEEV